MRKEKLFYQFYKAICVAFKPGIDKHSYKRANCSKVRIFSYADRKNIIKCTNQLCKYLEEKYSDLRFIKNINVDHINKFLEDKASYCSCATMKNYRYCIKKLEKMVKEYLHLNVKYINKDNVIKGVLVDIRNIKMKDNDLELLLRQIEKSSSKAVLGVKIAGAFGLRSEEICKLKGKDIDMERKILHVHEGKGKRSRNIPIESNEQMKICNEINEKIQGESRVCPIKPNSLNAVIRRILIKNKITRYADAKTGIHSIRKYYATKDYEKNFKELGNEKTAWDFTASKLGHGGGRTELKNVYVKGSE